METSHLLTDDWQLALGDNRFILTAPNFSSADKFIQKQTDRVLQWLVNWGFSECLVFYPNCKQPYRIPASLCSEVIMTQSIYLPGIQIDGIKLSIPLLRVLEEFLEFPERRYGLVRRSDQRQLAVHDTTHNNWRQFTSEFRLIQCPITQTIYEVTCGLDVVPCLSPI